MTIITLIGRQNVGKSTLFNRLTCTRDALVAELPGSTRDRRYGQIKWKNNKFTIVDTGGIIISKELIDIYTVKQSLTSITLANIILLIIDGYCGFTDEDKDLAKYLYKTKKDIIIVVNKIDKMYDNTIKCPFSFKENIIFVSALYNRGMNHLLKKITSFSEGCVAIKNEITKNREQKSMFTTVNNNYRYSLSLVEPIKVAIIGRTNVGKSTIINHILKEDRLIVHNEPNTTRDDISVSTTYNNKKYILVDTAGVHKFSKKTELIEKFSIIRTLKSIEKSHVLILVIDSNDGILNQDLLLINLILRKGKLLVIAVNKWDSIPSKMKNKKRKYIYDQLNFIVSFTKIHFISAKLGSGIDKLFDSVNETYQCSLKKIDDEYITKIMKTAIEKFQPPLVNGKKRVKLKYAKIKSYSPLIIVINGTYTHNIPCNYKKYLANYFRSSLKVTGTAVQIKFNESTNLFFTN